MVIMPQADSFTNALVLTISIPSFVLLSLVVDDTAEDENADEYGDVLLEYSYNGDSSCYQYDYLIQQVFSAIAYVLEFFSSIQRLVFLLINFIMFLLVRYSSASYLTVSCVNLIEGNATIFELKYDD
jgi:hypothetical protein